MFTAQTAKAYRKGYAAGRVVRNQRAIGDVNTDYMNPYNRADCARVWQEAYNDAMGVGRFTLETS